MKINHQILLYLLLFVPSIKNEVASSSNDATDDIVDDYSNQEDTCDSGAGGSHNSDSKDISNSIDLIIASIRESAVDILQDVGDLEDALASHDVKNKWNGSSTTTNSFSIKNTGIPSKKLCNNPLNKQQQAQKDILEDGKQKIKDWEAQIQACKLILDNTKKFQRSKIEGSNEKLDDGNAKASNSKEDISKKKKDTAKRVRRKLLRKSMGNFRPVYFA